MKLLIVLSFVVAFFFAACKSEEEKKTEKLAGLARQQAFADVKADTLKIDTVLGFSYAMVGQNTLDTFKRLYYSRRILRYKKFFDATLNLAKAGAEVEKFAGGVGKYGFLDAQGHNSLDYLEFARLYLDTMQHYGHLDSLVMKQIAERKNDEKVFYRTEIICSITSKEKTNIDTLAYFFDKDFRRIDISEKTLIGGY